MQEINHKLTFEKEKIYKFLEYLKKKKKERPLYCSDAQYETVFDEILSCINNDTVDNIYMNIAKVLSVVYDNYEFENIYFREDCYEYLIKSGFTKKEAYDLTTRIRKGKFNSNDFFDINKDKVPEKNFFLWAFRVRYLPSRRVIMKCFESFYDEFDMVN